MKLSKWMPRIPKSSTFGRDVTAETVIATILAKLNDPQAKLNRRERRALQRELDIAKGIQKPYPISQSTNDDIAVESECSIASPCAAAERSREEHEAIRQKGQEKTNSLSKRPADAGGDRQESLPKLLRVQVRQPSFFPHEYMRKSLDNSRSRMSWSMSPWH
ncbi:hypothetical protein TELCIR_22106 [Teladorsagia circumcincta]|uniref:Uncharacterized protein n=1 Tax=Teladorsagia circumcincta TaxID=45464 RepID=A0A2G9TEV4_TELCI|nr:hypothetical protein TELCIR_22106 [Teladorsagia circumcincta]